jgi:hypothetical protein
VCHIALYFQNLFCFVTLRCFTPCLIGTAFASTYTQREKDSRNKHFTAGDTALGLEFALCKCSLIFLSATRTSLLMNLVLMHKSPHFDTIHVIKHDIQTNHYIFENFYSPPLCLFNLVLVNHPLLLENTAKPSPATLFLPSWLYPKSQNTELWEQVKEEKSTRDTKTTPPTQNKISSQQYCPARCSFCHQMFCHRDCADELMDHIRRWYHDEMGNSEPVITPV